MAYLAPERAIVSLLSADAAVSALVSARIHPNKAPAPGASDNYPYLVYRDISVTSYEHATAASGMGQSLMQIDGWSRDYDEILDLREKVRLALHGVRGNCPQTVTIGADTLDLRSISLESARSIIVDPRDASDEAVYGFSQDWLLSYFETVP